MVRARSSSDMRERASEAGEHLHEVDSGVVVAFKVATGVEPGRRNGVDHRAVAQHVEIEGVRVEAHERRPEIAHTVHERLDEFRLTSLADVRSAEAADFPVALHALRQEGANAGDSGGTGALGNLPPSSSSALASSQPFEAVKAT